MTTADRIGGWDADLEPCRRCGRPVFWASTERMRRIPVDASADPLSGHLEVFRDDEGHVCAYHPANVSPGDRGPVWGRYTRHLCDGLADE
jgi:hypothetical protein